MECVLALNWRALVKLTEYCDDNIKTYLRNNKGTGVNYIHLG